VVEAAAEVADSENTEDVMHGIAKVSGVTTSLTTQCSFTVEGLIRGPSSVTGSPLLGLPVSI